MEENEYDLSIPKEDADEWVIEHKDRRRHDLTKQRKSQHRLPVNDDFPRQATIFLEE